MESRKQFHAIVEGEWLQTEEWWFLARDGNGNHYVIRERYEAKQARQGPETVLVQMMQPESVLARQDEVAAKLKAALLAEAAGED